MKTFLCLVFLFPLVGFAQYDIRGKVVNASDKTPVEFATVFLDNGTIANKTTAEGIFVLHNVPPGKYRLVVSDVEFEKFNQTVTVVNKNVELPNIELLARTNLLKEVVIRAKKRDPNWEKYFYWFKDEFLGTSPIAAECKILNPNVLSFDYAEETHTLKASSYDFLEIENQRLGYKIKYLLNDFLLQNMEPEKKKIYYKGSVLFEELKGNESQERQWKANRQAVFANSPMHFFRWISADRSIIKLNEQPAADDFTTFRVRIFDNPHRPSDTAINSKIEFYSSLKTPNQSEKDSLKYWKQKLKLPKQVHEFGKAPVNKKNMAKPTDQPNEYVLASGSEGLFVTISKQKRIHLTEDLAALNRTSNTENTLVLFNSPDILFNSNGIVINPYSMTFYGVWGRNRVAEMLPMDYKE